MKTRNLVVTFSLLAFTRSLGAADWPQWRGPKRDAISRETGLLKTWPSDGPKLLWIFSDAGVGFSAPAVVGNRLYLAGAYANTEYVYALDAEDGKKSWSAEIGPLFSNGYGDGPRGTPTVDGELLYVLGGQGNLVCVETSAGRKRWQVNMQREMGGRMMSGWGYSESPLVDGDRLICSPGGAQGTMAALDKLTGKVIWRSTVLTDPAAYSSIIAAEVGGVRQYIQMTGRGQAGVAADGRLLWRSEQCVNGTAIVSTPVFHDNHVYVTSDYGAGSALLKLLPDAQGTRCETVYANKDMQNHHGGIVLVDGHVYGWSGNSNGRGRWVCQEFQTGKVVWQEERKLGAGSLTYADGHFYLYGQADGTVVLMQATPSGWIEDGRFTIPRETKVPRKKSRVWTHPVVANGRLYLRDQDLLFCFDIQDHAAAGG